MRTGVDAQTGKVLTGWDHCVQSIGKCLSTRFNSRPWRRGIGSDVPDIQDDNADPSTLFRLYVAVSDALNDPLAGEPGFNLRSIALARAGRDGRFVLLMDGEYFPRGHRGDFSIREDVSATIAVEALQ